MGVMSTCVRRARTHPRMLANIRTRVSLSSGMRFWPAPAVDFYSSRASIVCIRIDFSTCAIVTWHIRWFIHLGLQSRTKCKSAVFELLSLILIFHFHSSQRAFWRTCLVRIVTLQRGPLNCWEISHLIVPMEKRKFLLLTMSTLIRKILIQLLPFLLSPAPEQTSPMSPQDLPLLKAMTRRQAFQLHPRY